VPEQKESDIAEPGILAGQKRFRDSDDFKKIVLTFALTTIVGGILAAFFQYLVARRSAEDQLHLADLSTATEVFNEVSRSTDKRLYRTRRLLWSRRASANEAEILTRRQLYDSSVQEWNESLNRNYALVERSFGRSARYFLENQISATFRCLSEELGRPNANLDNIEKEIDAFNPLVYRFNYVLSGSLQRGDVGSKAPSSIGTLDHSAMAKCSSSN
jgi:hypothetical protein